MAELTIEEARKIYASSDEMKSLMLTKFSKAELEKHNLTQEEFDKTFLEFLGQCIKTVFLDKHGHENKIPNNRVRLIDATDNWLFDIQFTGKDKHFWVSNSRIWNCLADTYSLNYSDIQRLMKNQMNTRFGMGDVTPFIFSHT